MTRFVRFPSKEVTDYIVDNTERYKLFKEKGINSKLIQKDTRYLKRKASTRGEIQNMPVVDRVANVAQMARFDLGIAPS